MCVDNWIADIVHLMFQLFNRVLGRISVDQHQECSHVAVKWQHVVAADNTRGCTCFLLTHCLAAQLLLKHPVASAPIHLNPAAACVCSMVMLHSSGC